MPTYEYECEKCGHEFERFQSMKDDPIKNCPECKAKKVRRLIGSGGGIIFKGTGFYETDYKRKESAPATPDSGSDNKSSNSKDNSKPEKKAEKKSEKPEKKNDAKSKKSAA